MSSNKKKKEQLSEKKHRKSIKAYEEKRAEELNQQLERARILKLVRMDRSKIRSCGRLVFDTPPDDSKHPHYYEDIPFHCQDCGKHEVWTGSQQKWWYEEAGGDIESTAIRCRECRAKERERKEEVTRLKDQGLKRARKERENK